jgi:hypothetical protein
MNNGEVVAVKGTLNTRAHGNVGAPLRPIFGTTHQEEQ